jgi:hypothetical protein
VTVTIKPRTWYPIAVGLSAVNLAAVWFAARPGEPWHATAHAGLALAFGLWAYRLRQARRGGELGRALEPLAFEVDELRRELAETQERLDFAERVLAQGRVPRREGPEE